MKAPSVSEGVNPSGEEKLTAISPCLSRSVHLWVGLGRHLRAVREWMLLFILSLLWGGSYFFIINTGENPVPLGRG
ncbi:hypothetical protein [Scytonema sp. NUACC26]|uniref:hypothetical protein n=1 Tax=Scytonema sp. NUACC26 TaxID=3140176 RepID=UPI0034DBC045